MLILLLTKTGSWRAGSEVPPWSRTGCGAAALPRRKYSPHTQASVFHRWAELWRQSRRKIKIQVRSFRSGSRQMAAMRSMPPVPMAFRMTIAEPVTVSDAASNRLPIPGIAFAIRCAAEFLKESTPGAIRHCTVCNPTATPITVFKDQSTIVCKSCANLEKRSSFCHLIEHQNSEIKL